MPETTVGVPEAKNNQKPPKILNKDVLGSTFAIQITKVTNSSLLVGQTASGPPSYIQVGAPGADFLGPGAQKHQFKDQTPKNGSS